VILLVRHASAGDRYEWEGDDNLRPLDERGLRQADELVELLAGYQVKQVVSSPALRCIQTLEPLALGLGFEVEIRQELSEQRQNVDGPVLVASLHDAAVSCHGGLSDTICEESQKKGEVIVLDGTEVVTRFRAEGR
jgi:phosphohistidine phosphatase SixA